MNKDPEAKPGRFVLQKRELLGLIALLFLVTLACSVPWQWTATQPGSVETEIAQTVEAKRRIATGTALAAEVEKQVSGETPVPSPSPSLTAAPVDTTTPTSRPTETITSAPENAQVGVSGDTFCRYGPGEVYQALGILNTNQQSEIIARDPTGAYWYIENPDMPGGECWIWGKYATPEGPTEQLPVFTPPPTPTPSPAITASFTYVCGSWYFDFQVKNTGEIPLESYQLTLKDAQTGVVETTLVNSWPGGCTGGGPDVLGVGETGRAYAEFLANDPLGHTMKATLKACQKDNLGGTCAIHTFSFQASK